MNPREAAKQVAELLLSSRPVRTIAAKRRANSRLVLGYHNIIAANARPVGDTRLHISFDSFRYQLDALEKGGISIVALDDPRPYSEFGPTATITFDDASAGAVELGVPELAARGIPATIFVAPALLGKPAPWWDLLATVEHGAVPPAVRAAALQEYRGDDSMVLAAAIERGWEISDVQSHFRIATESELSTAVAGHSALSLGSHSWSHSNLTALDLIELEAELHKSLEWLNQRWPDRTVPWIAYPYGLESKAVRAAVARAGYRGALRISGGWQLSALQDEFAAPRLHVSSLLTQRGFVARAMGLFPT